MARLELATSAGPLAIVGWRDDFMRAAVDVSVSDCARGGRGIDVIDFAGERAYFKRSFLRGKTRARWGLKHALWRARLPRVAEYYNLSWLTERLFLTPLPLAAGVIRTHGWPRYQFLITRAIDGAQTLAEFLQCASATERASVLAELARETARMHALRFVHHDLFPRNVIVAPERGQGRVHFLDAWAGGPPPNLRGAAYDLACLFLRPEIYAAGEIERFLERYAHERNVQARPIDLAHWRARIERETRALAPRVEREILRQRSPATPRR